MKWRERETEAQGEIGGAYRKSVGQKVGEHLEGASAPRFVTPLDRHRESATFVAKAIIYVEKPGGHNGSGCTASVAEGRQDRSEGFPTTRANCQPQITASQVTTSHYDRLAKRAIRQVTACKSVN